VRLDTGTSTAQGARRKAQGRGISHTVADRPTAASGVRVNGAAGPPPVSDVRSPGMRPDARRHRLWFLGAAVVGVAWGAAALAFDARSLWWDALLHLGPAVLGVVTLTTLIVWYPTGPARFAVDQRTPAFVAPVNQRRGVETAAYVLLLTSQVSLAIDTARADVAVAASVVAAVAAWMLLRIWRAPVNIELRPDGVHLPTGTLAWEMLKRGTPRQPKPTTQRLEIDARRSGVHEVAIDGLDINPWFLADAIRYYVAHPEHRASIGRPAEHQRLRQRMRG